MSDLTTREHREDADPVEEKSRKFRAWGFWEIGHIACALNRRFEIEELVAQDSFRVVYRALDRESGRIVAIRRLLPGGQGGEGYNEDRAAEFATAMQALAELECAGLRHPVVWGVDPVDRLPFVASEWVKGQSLSKFLEHGMLSAEAGWLLAERALTAQESLDTIQHGWQIDTSPESIIVAADDESFQFSFWVSPFPGSTASVGMVKDLASVIEHAMGWRGPMPSTNADAGLASWLRLVREHRMGASDAKHVLTEARQQAAAATQAPESMPPPGKAASLPARQAKLPAGGGPQPPSLKALGAALILLLLVALGGGWWIWQNIRQNPAAAANHNNSIPGKTQGKTPGHHSTPAEKASARAAELAKMAHENHLEDAADDQVFGPSDGALLRNFIGREITFQGVLRNVRDSTSGKTRYLEFANDRGVDDVCGRLRTEGAGAKSLSMLALKALVGRKITLHGEVQIESGTGRVTIHLTNREQITEPEPGN